MGFIHRWTQKYRWETWKRLKERQGVLNEAIDGIDEEVWPVDSANLRAERARVSVALAGLEQKLEPLKE